MTSGFYDVYGLAPHRTAETVAQFLSKLVPQRAESADEYEVPQFADQPEIIFDSAESLIAHCVEHLNVPHIIYWRSLVDGDPANAIAAFTVDGALILGLSVSSDPEYWLSEILVAINGDDGVILFEKAPPSSLLEFVALSRRSS